MPRFLLGLWTCAFVCSASLAVAQTTTPHPCGMQLNEMPVIFCDTFDAPKPVTNRSGQLDGVVWGVSRQVGGANVWADTTIDGCNGPKPASSIGATDVIVCNGQMRESVNDNHDVAVLAAYPKQPFNFAGRTGTISFDVSNDTTGPHGSWPELWVTDQPVPAPFTQYNPCAFCDLPRNGFGIRFGGNFCGGVITSFRADSVIVIRDYVPEDHPYYEHNTSGTLIEEKGCVKGSSGPNGGLNHIELKVTQDRIDVYASDAGSTTLRLINTITRANLTFTQGLVWISEAHYNAEKAHMQDPNLPDQRVHTYSWDNVAFDGPATYRDLSFDALDNTIVTGSADGHPVIQTGWFAAPGQPAVVQTLPITAAQIAAARNALLMFSWGKDVAPTAFTYAVNGHSNSVATPPALLKQMGFRTLAMAVPLDQLVAGPQKIEIASDALRLMVGNVNLVLVAAASVPIPGTDPPPVDPPPIPPPTTLPPCRLVVQVNKGTATAPQWMQLYVDAPPSFCAGAYAGG